MRRRCVPRRLSRVSLEQARRSPAPRRARQRLGWRTRAYGRSSLLLADPLEIDRSERIRTQGPCPHGNLTVALANLERRLILRGRSIDDVTVVERELGGVPL